MARDQRRLAAIVSADVVGYSRLMGRDESGTLAALKAHRRELVDPKIAEYDGRIVKTTGDGLLLDFPSVVEAVRCGVDVQRGMAVRNADVLPDDRIEFRIGINVGDIIIDGDDIFGDGVNVAARLQTLADPGGICVSRAVRDQVLDKLSFGFDELGAQQVKNIARPVEVFRIRDDGASAAVRSRGAHGLRWATGTRTARWAALVVAFAAVGIAAWQIPRWLRPATVPPPFSFAVMPFRALTGKPSEVRFANALTDNLATLMAKSKLERVSSGRSVQSEREKGADARTLGRELDVRYLIDGEVRADAGKTTVSLHLVDAASGLQTWSDQLQTDDPASAAQQRELTIDANGRLRVALYAKELQRAVAHPVRGSATDAYLQGDAARSDAFRAAARAGRDMPQPEAFDTARKHYEDALKIDPDFVPALLGLSEIVEFELRADLDADAATRARWQDEIDRLTSRAVGVDNSWWPSWFERAMALELFGKCDQALEANARARSLDDLSDSSLVDQYGFLLLHLDRPEEALAIGKQSVDMLHARGTSQDGFAQRLVCRSNLLLGRYNDAVAPCEKAAADDDWWPDQLSLIAIYAQLGEDAKAAAAKATLLKKKPDFTLERASAGTNFCTSGNRERVETHVNVWLRKAGVP